MRPGDALWSGWMSAGVEPQEQAGSWSHGWLVAQQQQLYSRMYGLEVRARDVPLF